MMYQDIDRTYILQHAYENTYHLTVSSIQKLRILDWDRLHELLSGMSCSEVHDNWCCHTEGCNLDGEYDYENECLLLFDKDGSIRCRFLSDRGLSDYVFEDFYNSHTIHTKQEFGVQVNALKFLTKLLSDQIIAKE